MTDEIEFQLLHGVTCSYIVDRIDDVECGEPAAYYGTWNSEYVLPESNRNWHMNVTFSCDTHRHVPVDADLVAVAEFPMSD